MAQFPDITSANAVVVLNIPGVAGAGANLEQFSMEDIFTTQPAEANETMMGVDGILSAGYIFTPKKMEISLMANSPSIALFDAWYQTMSAQVAVIAASGSITLPSVGYIYTLFNGFLTRYSTTSDARRVLQPRRFEITWNAIISTQAALPSGFATAPGTSGGIPGVF